jgi:hypothetical protein
LDAPDCVGAGGAAVTLAVAVEDISTDDDSSTEEDGGGLVVLAEGTDVEENVICVGKKC